MLLVDNNGINRKILRCKYSTHILFYFLKKEENRANYKNNNHFYLAGASDGSSLNSLTH